MPLARRARAGLARRAARREERARADPRRAAPGTAPLRAARGRVSAGTSLALEELRALVRAPKRSATTRPTWTATSPCSPAAASADVLDGWTVTTALLAAHRAHRGSASIRLVHHWNAARLAQASATLGAARPGAHAPLRLDRRPAGGPPLRAAAAAARRSASRGSTRRSARCARLWRGEAVTLRGRFVTLDGARVRPAPRGGRLPIEVGARRPAPARAWSRATPTPGT